MDSLLTALKAVAEPTRLRLLALCAQGELTVSDLTHILGQSQPRVSRHLKLLCDAGLLERSREGTWALFRLAEGGEGARLSRQLLGFLPEGDSRLALDRQRLAALRQAQAERAAQYFRDNADRWHEIRSLHVPEREVEAALLRLLPEAGLHDLLDIGTGTGRMLELFGPRIERGLGVDASREMLGIARANLDRAALRHCQVRQADMYALPLPSASFDAVVVHQVLHYAEQPGEAIAEAARMLRPGGRLAIADFAQHDVESLRSEHAHRRLGFADAEIAAWCRAAGLEPQPPVRLPGVPLTVVVWTAIRNADAVSLLPAAEAVA
ncbi:MAG TPA: metalloregulator ArsR/SmtB family transcription factor [Alphaproteobacteria bacterium]|nr:metalloregulator ArsR/SmtB family transcription factor [Alphaproteobacteria bacterium]